MTRERVRNIPPVLGHGGPVTATAFVALARRLAGILYALLRDGTTFDPRPSASRGHGDERLERGAQLLGDECNHPGLS
jgi:hypothetical protein